MQFIKDFTIAFATGDTAHILESFTDDADWQMVGGERWQGKDAIATALTNIRAGEVTELVVHTIMSHGKLASANGLFRFNDGSEVAFCDVYRFSSHAKDAKIQELVAYVINTK